MGRGVPRGRGRTGPVGAGEGADVERAARRLRGDADDPAGRARAGARRSRQRRAVPIGLANGDDRRRVRARALALTLTRRTLAGIASTPPRSPRSSKQRWPRSNARRRVRRRHGPDHRSRRAPRRRRHRSAAVAPRRPTPRGCGDRFVPGRVEWIQGVLAGQRGDLDAAYRHIERGLRLLDELGMGQEVTAQAALLIDLAERLGEHDLAEQWRTFVGGRSGGLARHDVCCSHRRGTAKRCRLGSRRSRAGRAAHLEALAGNRRRRHGATPSPSPASASSPRRRETATARRAPRRRAGRRRRTGSPPRSRSRSRARPPRRRRRAEWAALLLGAARGWGTGADDQPEARRLDVEAAQIEGTPCSCVGRRPAFPDAHFRRGTTLELTREAWRFSLHPGLSPPLFSVPPPASVSETSAAAHNMAT